MLAHFLEGLVIVLNLATVIHFQLRTVHATWRFEIAKLLCVHFWEIFTFLPLNFVYLWLNINPFSHRDGNQRTIILGYKSALKMGLFADMKTLTSRIEQLAVGGKKYERSSTYSLVESLFLIQLNKNIPKVWLQ